TQRGIVIVMSHSVHGARDNVTRVENDCAHLAAARIWNRAWSRGFLKSEECENRTKSGIGDIRSWLFITACAAVCSWTGGIGFVECQNYKHFACLVSFRTEDQRHPVFQPQVHSDEPAHVGALGIDAHASGVVTIVTEVRRDEGKLRSGIL